jgi:hypothetical protein
MKFGEDIAGHKPIEHSAREEHECCDGENSRLGKVAILCSWSSVATAWHVLARGK